jgi:hypothetical protein
MKTIKKEMRIALLFHLCVCVIVYNILGVCPSGRTPWVYVGGGFSGYV